jgi:hypothetical protein
MTKFLLLVTIFSANLFGNADEENSIKKLKVEAIRTSSNIVIDGILNEEIWQTKNFVENFKQRDPNEGAEPTEKTKVYVAFDEEALYVGARMYDSSPDSIIARLTRKDAFVNSDLFAIFIDPYNDKRSGYYFGLSAAGTLLDGVLYNDDWDDDSWDGVWEGRVNIDDEGWTVEMKIPFSQLKFHENNLNSWGVNFRRDIARKNEIIYLVYTPKKESGFVSRFAELTGIENIKAGSQIEILPYITTRAEYKRKEIDNPFSSKSKYIPGYGADLKMGIGTNLTLNATVNPDFGQVEIDPAVINLSDVETFFSEKRPFFVEGSTIFNFGVGGARNYWGFNWPGPDLFYSRRIGRAPRGSTPDNDYSNYPDGTHILGAAKITGKVGENWNIGAIQALTSREFADIQFNRIKSEAEVEPLAYYGVLRAQKEISEGFYGLGFMSTTALRNFKDDRLRNEFNSVSYSLGLDGWTFLDSSRTWVVTGWMGMSHIQGNENRLISIQRNSAHYFQRPDAKNFKVDSSLTSLTGYAGRFYINKQKGNVFFNSAFGFITPEFDVNDLGFLWRSDVINWHIGAGYQWTEPTDFYRYIELGGAVFQNFDFDWNRTWEGIFHFGYFQFTNYYSINWNAAYNPQTVNNRKTRGGPLMLNTPGYQFNLYLSSDDRKNLVFNLGGYTYQSEHQRRWEISSGIEIRPADNFTFSISPFYARNNDYAQYLTTVSDELAALTFGNRYIFGELDQKTFGAGIRMNWTFTPHLSLQLYVQPLISSGKYTAFKELAVPNTHTFNRYGEGNSSFDNVNYIADPDGDGPANPIEIENPNFNFKSLRGNAVLRWEYLPGSVLYFVWTQTRSDFENVGDFQFTHSFDRLLDVHPENIFMIKLTYWFNL